MRLCCPLVVSYLPTRKSTQSECWSWYNKKKTKRERDICIKSYLFILFILNYLILIFYLVWHSLPVPFILSKLRYHVIWKELLYASFGFGFLRPLAFNFCFAFFMLLEDWHRCLVCCCSSLVDRHLKHQSEISCKKPRCWRHMVLIPIHARFFKHFCTIYRLQAFKSDCFVQLVTSRTCENICLLEV